MTRKPMHSLTVLKLITQKTKDQIISQSTSTLTSLENFFANPPPTPLAPTNTDEIVRVQYFVRGGFVGYRSRASSKASLPSSSGRRARFLGGSNRGCVAPARCTCGCRVHKESRLDVDVFEK
ncbi:hypothetical protein TNCV_452971 [Trichonephila clavipes]|nr:hypothetical protein TNCV_452971 [Trichonephila clavipes]